MREGEPVDLVIEGDTLVIRTRRPRYSWKVMLPDGLSMSGAVLVDRVRAIDRDARRLRLAGHAPQTVVAEVQAKLAALFGLRA